jgi:hypothetical protein
VIKITKSKGFWSTITWSIYLLLEFSKFMSCLDGNSNWVGLFLVPTIPFTIHDPPANVPLN